MPAPAPVAEILAALEEAFGQLELRWYLFGAQAVLLWGRPRTTFDVDVTVRVEPDQAPLLIRTLAGHGFDLRIQRDVDEFVRRTRVLPFQHRPSGIPVDVVLGGPGFEEEFLDRAVPVTIGGRPIPVLAPGDLVVMKLLASRAKDIEDVVGVLAERGDSLDLERIRETLKQLEDAIGQSDLLPAFESALERARREQDPEARR